MYIFMEYYFTPKLCMHFISHSVHTLEHFYLNLFDIKLWIHHSGLCMFFFVVLDFLLPDTFICKGRRMIGSVHPFDGIMSHCCTPTGYCTVHYNGCGTDTSIKDSNLIYFWMVIQCNIHCHVIHVFTSEVFCVKTCHYHVSCMRYIEIHCHMLHNIRNIALLDIKPRDIPDQLSILYMPCERYRSIIETSNLQSEIMESEQSPSWPARQLKIHFTDLLNLIAHKYCLFFTKSIHWFM